METPQKYREKKDSQTLNAYMNETNRCHALVCSHGEKINSRRYPEAEIACEFCEGETVSRRHQNRYTFTSIECEE